MTAPDESKSPSLLRWNAKTTGGIGLVTLIYFADILLKASHKCFWFDELFTVYLCRLPSTAATWAAVTHGADFNPPLLYCLTRVVQRIFGEGLIATRLPSMFGVWLFGFCLFVFVSKRAGMLSGAIAGIFPFFTLAQYYAYEARAHGMVLGWCGLALVCWQRTTENRARYFWLAGFGFAILGALLTHVYAIYVLVPFGVVELFGIFKRRVNWPLIAVMLITVTWIVAAVYLPLFHVYRMTVTPDFRLAGHELLQRFLITAIGPALLLLLLYLFLSFFDGKEPIGAMLPMPMNETVMGVSFLTIPLLGLLGSKISHGPFIDRYFLSTVAGYAIILGFASSWRLTKWTARVLVFSMLLLMAADLAVTAYLVKNQRLVLVEPSIGLVLTTSPADPMRLYETLKEDKDGLDILVLPEVEELYFYRYAPPSIVPHLYFGAPPNNLFSAAYQRLATGAHLDLRVTTFSDFLSSHRRFLVYEGRNTTHSEAAEALATWGLTLKAAHADAGGTLYEYMR